MLFTFIKAEFWNDTEGIVPLLRDLSKSQVKEFFLGQVLFEQKLKRSAGREEELGNAHPSAIYKGSGRPQGSPGQP